MTEHENWNLKRCPTCGRRPDILELAIQELTRLQDPDQPPPPAPARLDLPPEFARRVMEVVRDVLEVRHETADES